VLSKPKTFRDSLKTRREALSSFAGLACSSAKAVAFARREMATAMAAASSASSAKKTSKKAAKKASEKSVKKPTKKAAKPDVKLPEPIILEAVGAIIMEEDMVDREALESAYRAVVVENFAIALEMPSANDTNAAVDTK